MIKYIIWIVLIFIPVTTNASEVTNHFPVTSLQPIKPYPQYNQLDKVPLLKYIREHNLIDGNLKYKNGLIGNTVSIKFLAFYQKINIFDSNLLSKFEFHTKLGSDDTLNLDVDSYQLSMRCVIRFDK